MLYNLINGAILRFHHTSLNDFFVRKLDLDPKWARLSFMAPGPARIYWGDPRNKPSFLSSTSFWYQNIDFGQPFLRCYCFFFINPDVWNCSCCSFKKVRFVVVFIHNLIWYDRFVLLFWISVIVATWLPKLASCCHVMYFALFVVTLLLFIVVDRSLVLLFY